uniref:Exocyst complex component SEC3A n=1 Tax=Cajanus cajan TaxID=3821 RepID=A0A151R0W8_CAJCA|nr:Exocyst complex component SEC3A [Cajanus cajan]
MATNAATRTDDQVTNKRMRGAIIFKPIVKKAENRISSQFLTQVSKFFEIVLPPCVWFEIGKKSEDFYAVVDWAYKIDPLCCISMHGTTERYLSSQKADAAGFVRILLGDLESRISMLFSRFVDEACHQIERHERNARQTGVLPYIPRKDKRMCSSFSQQDDDCCTIHDPPILWFQVPSILQRIKLAKLFSSTSEFDKFCGYLYPLLEVYTNGE